MTVRVACDYCRFEQLPHRLITLEAETLEGEARPLRVCASQGACARRRQLTLFAGPADLGEQARRYIESVTNG